MEVVTARTSGHEEEGYDSRIVLHHVMHTLALEYRVWSSVVCKRALILYVEW